MNTNFKTGLNDKEVLYSRNKYGSNTITKKKKKTILSLFIESLNDPIIKILLFALGIKIVLIFDNSDVYETLGIAVAVFLASFISVISEYGSEKAFERLNEEYSSINIKAFRNSKKISVNIDELVVGDIVFLESGDKIPCDGIIIDGEIYVDESMLSGESKEKHLYKNSKVFMGSIVVNKKATIMVSIVGDRTYYGKIASNVQNEKNESPLKYRLRGLAKTISIFGYIGAFLVFLSYMFNSVVLVNDYSYANVISNLLYALTLSVAVVVMAVPEGLPMMVTLVLSSNMKKLLKRNVLVRKLVGIETSGSLNILFTDKTGTLTEGKLKVNSFVDAMFNEYNSFSDIKNNYDVIYQSLVYNNDSFFSNGKVEGGNITDKAIISFVSSDIKSSYRIINSIPFDSKLKYSCVQTNYNGCSYFYKGAYEILFNKCMYYLNSNGEKRVLIDKDKYYKYIKNRTSMSERVLTLCYSNNSSFENLILIGFIFLKDNIRKESYEAIKSIEEAGIQVVMLTGDAYDTAYSVARELNLAKNSNDLVISSDELHCMSDVELKKKLYNIKVISRCLPEDKIRLVRIAQESNLVVGMTGDGVNDASALKKANVGFSMGSGSEVAKETSDIVILDNNINSISYSILYGRTIFKSIRKFVTFQLSVNVCAVFLSIIGPFIGIMAPITVIQVLWVNMVMDTFSGLAFSFEPALKEYMCEKSKNLNEKIINNYMKNEVIVDGIYSTILCIIFLKSHLVFNVYKTEKSLMSAFFGLFIFIDIFNAFNARTSQINTFSNMFKNKIFLLIFLFITIVQIILIYYGGELFRTTGLTLLQFEVMILFACSILIIDIIRKIILKKRNIDRNF